jgi:nucleoside-diphosphate-sugar epimerase
MFHALYDLPVVVLRVFMVYGPKQRDLTKLIPYVGLCLHRGRAPELASGRRFVDWVYVEDVTGAFVAAAAADGVEGRTIDVGTGELVSVRTIVEKMTSLIAPSIEPRFGVLADPPFEASPHADVDSAFASLGWRAQVTLEEGLRATARWLGNISGADIEPAQEGGASRTSD